MGHGGHHQPGGVKPAGHGSFFYPDEEILKQLGNRAFSLKKHQKENIEEIEKRLKSGQELPKKELEDYQTYLEELSYKLKEILHDEQSEKISNLKLEKDLRKVAQLLGQITSVLERH
ncbi:hypothetical protein HN789_07225 [archaeon]|jgi:hypothetical protein|nr:hypothetical protein [archaeon]MBT4021773.1 hypothetical protein [archaeon]MBT4271812.1 hypothetical protein [archaeon]MBT4460493.1 hypothetical protein [archaeon]MBT4858513.1 hypothetical protein [archaeon]